MAAQSESIVVPAMEGRAVRVAKGQRLRIVTPKGAQAADFFAYNAETTGEWLSPPHTWVWNRTLKPRAGQTLLTRFRRPMFRFTDDGADGVHDMLLAACDQFRYEQCGFEGHHPSCAENLMIAMRREGYEIDVVPQPINWFTATTVDPDSALGAPPNPVPPGAYVEVEALMDTICVVSSCPFDLGLDDWAVNAPGGPTALELEVRG